MDLLQNSNAVGKAWTLRMIAMSKVLNLHLARIIIVEALLQGALAHGRVQAGPLARTA